MILGLEFRWAAVLGIVADPLQVMQERSLPCVVVGTRDIGQEDEKKYLFCKIPYDKHFPIQSRQNACVVHLNVLHAYSCSKSDIDLIASILRPLPYLQPPVASLQGSTLKH